MMRQEEKMIRLLWKLNQAITACFFEKLLMKKEKKNLKIDMNLFFLELSRFQKKCWRKLLFVWSETVKWTY